MISFRAKAPTSTAVAVATFLSVEVAKAEIAPNPLIGIPPTNSLTAKDLDLLKESLTTSIKGALRESIATERRELPTVFALRKDPILRALNEIDTALEAGSDDKLISGLSNYGAAKRSSLVATDGLYLLFLATLSTLHSITSLFSTSRIKQDLDKVLARPYGLNFQERNFLEERISYARGRIELLGAAFDTYAYIAARDPNPTDVNAAFFRTKSFLFLGGMGITASAIGAVMLTGDIVSSFFALTTGMTAVFVTGIVLSGYSLSRRGSRVVEQYKLWQEKN